VVLITSTRTKPRSRRLLPACSPFEQFAYVTSHDLQEPLRTISSFTQLLAKRYRDKLDDKAREFIDFAVDGCKRMQTLVNDLLAFSRVGTEAKALQPVRGDAVLDRALKSLRIAIQESGAQIHRSTLPGPGGILSIGASARCLSSGAISA
jgi:two-component system, chemotaxis family, sensor kinase Cph1